MTRTAIFEQEKEKEIEIAAKYKRKDYVRSRFIKGLLGGATYYLLTYLIVVLFVSATFLNKIDGLTIFGIIAVGILWLGIRLYFHLRHLRRIAGEYYDECESSREDFDSRIRILGMMYDDEQARTMSWSGDFE